MPRLIIFVPFTPKAGDTLGVLGDLRFNAWELTTARTDNLMIADQNINEVIAVYGGQEAVGVNQVAPGDVLVVHAHGSPDNLSVGDNMGETLTGPQLLAKINLLNAVNASAVYFVICYSGLPRHIAPDWKAGNPAQIVFGSDKVIQGSLVKLTRSGGIIGNIFNKDPRLQPL